MEFNSRRPSRSPFDAAQTAATSSRSREYEQWEELTPCTTEITTSSLKRSPSSPLGHKASAGSPKSSTQRSGAFGRRCRFWNSQTVLSFSIGVLLTYMLLLNHPTVGPTQQQGIASHSDLQSGHKVVRQLAADLEPLGQTQPNWASNAAPDSPNAAEFIVRHGELTSRYQKVSHSEGGRDEGMGSLKSSGQGETADLGAASEPAMKGGGQREEDHLLMALHSKEPKRIHGHTNRADGSGRIKKWQTSLGRSRKFGGARKNGEPGALAIKVNSQELKAPTQATSNTDVERESFQEQSANKLPDVASSAVEKSTTSVSEELPEELKPREVGVSVPAQQPPQPAQGVPRDKEAEGQATEADIIAGQEGFDVDVQLLQKIVGGADQEEFVDVEVEAAAPSELQQTGEEDAASPDVDPQAQVGGSMLDFFIGSASLDVPERDGFINVDTEDEKATNFNTALQPEERQEDSDLAETTTQDQSTGLASATGNSQDEGAAVVESIEADVVGSEEAAKDAADSESEESSIKKPVGNPENGIRKELGQSELAIAAKQGAIEAEFVQPSEIVKDIEVDSGGEVEDDASDEGDELEDSQEPEISGKENPSKDTESGRQEVATVAEQGITAEKQKEAESAEVNGEEENRMQGSEERQRSSDSVKERAELARRAAEADKVLQERQAKIATAQDVYLKMLNVTRPAYMAEIAAANAAVELQQQEEERQRSGTLQSHRLSDEKKDEGHMDAGDQSSDSSHADQAAALLESVTNTS